MYGTIEHSSDLRQCRCGQVVSVGVSLCPRCGAPVQESAEPMDDATVSFIIPGPYDADSETEETTSAAPRGQREAAKRWRRWRK